MRLPFEGASIRRFNDAWATSRSCELSTERIRDIGPGARSDLLDPSPRQPTWPFLYPFQTVIEVDEVRPYTGSEIVRVVEAVKN